MKHLLTLLILIFYFSTSNAAKPKNDICDEEIDLSGFIIINGDFILESAEIREGDYYVMGNVLFNKGQNANIKTTLNGSLYVVGDVVFENFSHVEGFVYSEGTIDKGNNGNIEIVEGECNGGDPIVAIDLPVEELSAQCSDIFTDAAQSFDRGTLSILSGRIEALVNDFDFAFYEGNLGSCGEDSHCTVTGNSSLPLTEFYIPNIIAQNLTRPESGQISNIILGVALEDEDISAGKYNGTTFGDITLGADASAEFLEQNDPIQQMYQINKITLGPGSELTLNPGVYAVHEFSGLSGSQINVQGTGDVHLFIENVTDFSADIESQSDNLYLVTNSNLTLINTQAIDGYIYVNGDLIIEEGASVNGKVASTNLSVDGLITDTLNCRLPPETEYSFQVITSPDALTCSAHPVTINVSNNGQIADDYTGTITVTTSTDLGEWQIGDGKGTLNPVGADLIGQAQYQFSALDNGSVTLGLFNNIASELSITVTGEGIDDTSELITFRPFLLQTLLSCENAISGQCINIANRPFTLQLTAVGEDQATGTCQIIEEYAGGKDLKFWSSYLNPVSATGLAVEIDQQTIASNAIDAVGQMVIFTAGVANVSVNYPDAGKIQVHARDDMGIGAPPGEIGDELQGSATTIVNPLQLEIINVTGQNSDDGSSISNPKTISSGSGFIRASVADYNDLSVDTFNVTVTAVKDCSNDPNNHCIASYSNRTPSFAHEIDLQPSLVFPSSGTLGALQYDGDDGFKQDLPAQGHLGQFTYENLAYDEVGTLGLDSIANDYLIAGNSIQTSVVKHIGRFYPDYLAYGNFTAIPACNDDFTYLGQQAIKLSYNMKAYAQGALQVTENYDDSLGYPVAPNDNFDHYAYDQSPLELTDRLTPSDYYQEQQWIAGQYNLVDLLFGVDKALSPDGPYFSNNRIDYFTQLIGIDGEKMQQESQTDCSAGQCKLGDLGDLAYGRLQAGNGHGSEFQPIRTNVEASYFNGEHFVIMEREDCTQVDIGQVSIVPDPASFAGKTTLSILNSPLNAGTSYFEFSASGEAGKLTYFVQLQSQADPFLYTPWLLDSGNAVACPVSGVEECISGVVEFGLFRGNDRIIYRLQTFD